MGGDNSVDRLCGGRIIAAGVGDARRSHDSDARSEVLARRRSSAVFGSAAAVVKSRPSHYVCRAVFNGDYLTGLHVRITPLVRIYRYGKDFYTHEPAGGSTFGRLFGAPGGRSLLAVGSERFALNLYSTM